MLERKGKILAGQAALYTVLAAGLAVIWLSSLFFTRSIKEENTIKELEKNLAQAAKEIESRLFTNPDNSAAVVLADPRTASILLEDSKAVPPEFIEVLEAIRAPISADIVYVMNEKGDVVASTSYRHDDLTGKNYSFRPYFTEAIKGKRHSYAGLGVTTNRRGIYFSYPVYSGDRTRPRGVLVVKAGLEPADQILSRFTQPAVLISPEGVIFSSNRKELLFTSVIDIPAASLERIRKENQFAGTEIRKAPVTNSFASTEEYLEGIRHYCVRKELSRKGWSVVLCEKSDSVAELTVTQRNSFIAAVSAVSILFTLIMILLLARLSAEAVRQSEMNYNEIFNSVNDAIFIHDASTGKIIDVNNKMLEMYGCAREQALSAAPSTTSFEEDPENKAMEYMRKAARGEPQVFEWKAKRVDNGAEFTVEVNLKRARISGRDVIIAVVRDIAERKKAHDELKRSNEELQQFAYIVSHDLKEPLRMVKSYVELLERRYKDKLDQPANDFIHFAVDGAKNMETLINDILEYSRVGSRQVNISSVDTGALVTEIMEFLKILILDSGAKI
ncbi:MAG TPA: PAS domain S-box protein, partial [Candidatus Goldiibacteriota bacterium]|nr:PAS domain S-box protein [Candidatus Goldiibacteriota bacterium]